MLEHVLQEMTCALKKYTTQGLNKGRSDNTYIKAGTLNGHILIVDLIVDIHSVCIEYKENMPAVVLPSMTAGVVTSIGTVQPIIIKCMILRYAGGLGDVRDPDVGRGGVGSGGLSGG